MTRLRSSDLAALLAFLQDAHDLEGSEPYPTSLLDRLAALVPSDFVTFNELDRIERVVGRYVPVSWEDPTLFQGMSHEDCSLLDRHALWPYRGRSGHFVTVMLSDLFGRGERGRFELLPDNVRPWGIVDEVWLDLVPSFTRIVAVGFQSQRRDYSERDRAILERLRPHLAVFHRNAATRQRLGSVIAGLERGLTDGRGVIVLGTGSVIEYASVTAWQQLDAFFVHDAGTLPAELRAWVDRRRRDPSLAPYVIVQGESRLVLDAAGADCSSLLLVEERMPNVSLTPREWDVMRAVASGKTNAEVARLLWVEPGTVRRHLEHVYRKLGVHSRTAAVARLRPYLPIGRVDPLSRRSSGSAAVTRGAAGGKSAARSRRP